MRTGFDWRDEAACRDVDADLFFPVGTMGPGPRQIEEAKRICRACPAQAACLAWAIATGSPRACGEVPPRTSGVPCGDRPPWPVTAAGLLPGEACFFSVIAGRGPGAGLWSR
jgi:hypothetical protein